MRRDENTQHHSGSNDMATSQSIPVEPDQSTNDKPSHHSSWRIWARRALTIAATVLAIGVVAGAYAFHRVERNAAEVADIGTSLKTFTGLLASAVKKRAVDRVLELHHVNYSSQEGRWDMNLVSDRDDVQVYSWSESQPRGYSKSDLEAQYQDYFSSLGTIEESKVKVLSIDEFDHDNTAVIRSMLWLRGHDDEGKTVESRLTFRMEMVREQGDWLLQGKNLLDGQTVVGKGQGFANIVTASKIGFRAARNPLFEQSEWHPSMYEIFKYASAGVATADFDNDGWYDIYFCDGDSPCLYRNMADGTFEDVTSSAGLPADLDGVQVALFVDFDNDGDRDLFLGRTTGDNRLFENLTADVAGSAATTSATSGPSFRDVTEKAGVSGQWITSAAAGDFDNDGLVDLYLGRYLDPRTSLPTTNFYTRNGLGNTLLKNEGNLRFSDATESAGVREGGLTLAIAWGDYDADGDQDMYVANDFGRNALFQNNGDGTFDNVAKVAGAVSVGYGMSANFEDIDNDGDLDIYVAGVHSGQRWFGNAATIKQYVANSIKEGTYLSELPLYRDLHREIDFDWNNFGSQIIGGNSLLLNTGDGRFVDATETSHANPHGWFWGAAICDFDNDGLQDIYASNGWITGKKLDDL